MPIAIKMAGKEIASYDTTTDKVAIKLGDDVSINDSAGNVVLGNSGLTSNVVFPALGNSAVGTVSQSSGTPTGDIIERGSNANGEYVKYADGTLICTRQEYHDATTTDNVTFDYPSSFYGFPSVAMGHGNGNLSTTADSVNTVVQRISYAWRVRTASAGSNNSILITLIAIGRWY